MAWGLDALNGLKQGPEANVVTEKNVFKDQGHAERVVVVVHVSEYFGLRRAVTLQSLSRPLLTHPVGLLSYTPSKKEKLHHSTVGRLEEVPDL